MHGFCGILSKDTASINKNAFKKSINLADTMHVDTYSDVNFFSTVSFLDSAPIKGQRFYKTKDLIILFTGDLIELKEIPWKEIEANYLNSNFKWFSSLRGLFAFVIYNKKLKQISLISDHRAQIPVYYGIFENNFIFSTDLSTFTTLKAVPDFNIEWLYEYMFFNFPIDRTTFLKGVSKLRPISILNFDQNSNSIKESQYGEYFKKSKNILTGKAALDINIRTFKDRIPKYYNEGEITLAAISGGFDSRTLLSLAPEEAKVETYTYGVKGSHDLNTVATFIKKLKIKHKEILFNEKFKKSLPTLIYDTVRLSGGVQSILRSTLLYVYKDLYQNSYDVSVIIGGINGDFFRGWSDLAAFSTSYSFGVQNFFDTGVVEFNDKINERIFTGYGEEFKTHTKNTLVKVEKLYGYNDKSVLRMNYSVYEIDPNYFGGEIAIASYYFTCRQPFWDMDLMGLPYKTECGHLGIIKNQNKKKYNPYKKYVLQSKVIADNPKFKRTYINGLPISLLAHGNEFLIKISRIFIRGFAYLKGYKPPKNDLEEWDDWFKNNLHSEFDKLLNDNSLILEYINNDYIKSAKKSNDIHLLSKFATTEIILNLIKNRWNIK